MESSNTLTNLCFLGYPSDHQPRPVNAQDSVLCVGVWLRAGIALLTIF